METNSEGTELSHPAPSTLTCHQQHWLEVEPLGVSTFPVLSDHFTTSGLPLAERNVLLNEVSSPDTDSVSRACHAFLLAFCNGCQSHLHRHTAIVFTTGLASHVRVFAFLLAGQGGLKKVIKV